MDRSIVDLRNSSRPLRDAVLALNTMESEATSPLDSGALDRLIAESAFAAAVTGAAGLEAFLLGFGPGAAYQSPNYRWFAARLDRFAYIDRVVVDPSARGRGHARRLYHAFSAARPDLGPLVCEVNLDPPNPGSDAFHAALGFAELGRGNPVPGKTVRYLIRNV